MNIQEQTDKVDSVQANAQAQAKAAAEAAANAEASEAVQLAKKIIKSDMKSAANTSHGVFMVIRTATDWAEAGSAFDIAERRIMQDLRVSSMAELARESGVSNFSYVSIKNVMLKAVKDADDLGQQLQSLYDFEYDGMTTEEQAKNARDYVPEGFLNPWSTRYADTADEKGATRFNRDRKLAVDSIKLLDKGRKDRLKAKVAAEKAAVERHQVAMAQAAGTADTAPAGSGATAQGMNGHRSAGRVLSAVVQTNLNLLINAIHSASDYLADSEILPIIGNAADKILALVEAERVIERTKTAEQSRSHDNPHTLEGEQSELEDGDVIITAADLPDVPTLGAEEADPADDSDMTEADKANLAAAIEQDLERKAQ